MNSEPVETCTFFVDDSNLWINAQKFSATGGGSMPKLIDSAQDPRRRINLGKLINTIRGGRRLDDSLLYGSRPPPNDSVWKAAKHLNFEVKVYDRAGGKEKQVDNSIASDMAERATVLDIEARYSPKAAFRKANTTFVVISGDLDMRPPVMRALHKGIRVEIWAMKSSLSNGLRDLSRHQGLLSIRHLDHIMDSISFTSYSSTRQDKQPDPGQTLIISGYSDPGDDHEELKNFICGQLLQLNHIFYHRWTETKMEMLIEIPNAKSIETMIRKTRELFKLLTILSWPEYIARRHNQLPAIPSTSNMYEPLSSDNEDCLTPSSETAERRFSLSELSNGVEEEKEETELVQQDFDNYDEWQMVNRSDPKQQHRRSLRQAQKCRFGIRCNKRGECGHGHSAKELQLFQNQPNRKFQYWKTQWCKNARSHRREDCSFAHDKEEAWCLRCRYEGHMTDECQFGAI